MFSPWSILTNYDFKHYFDEDKNRIILYALRTGKGFKWVTTPKIQISNKLFNKNIMAVIQEFYLRRLARNLAMIFNYKMKWTITCSRLHKVTKLHLGCFELPWPESPWCHSQTVDDFSWPCRSLEETPGTTSVVHRPEISVEAGGGPSWNNGGAHACNSKCLLKYIIELKQFCIRKT